MISIQEALEIIQNNLPEKQVETVSLLESLGKVLAEDIHSPEPSPRYTNSAMDGFAVRWQDVAAIKDGGEVKFPVIGESSAGVPFTGSVQTGQAVRINTGAMLPHGTDCVVPVEDVEERDNAIRVLRAVNKKQHIRFRGEEFPAGVTVLQKGSHLTPATIGLLTALGIKQVLVFHRPQVAIITTGTELVTNSAKIKPWQIRDSNGPMLSAAVQFSDGKVVATTHSGDDLTSIRRQIRRGAERAQLVIVSGGVSVGPHDLVKEAAGKEGFDTLFWRVNQKPGKPLFLAKKNGVLLFGLPGNPVSVLNCFVYYIHPVLQRLQGSDFRWETVTGILVQPVANKGMRNLFLRVQLQYSERGQIRVTPVTAQGSHMLTSLAAADGFVLLAPEEAKTEEEIVKVYLYPWRR